VVADAMRELLRRQRPDVVVEIGVFGGQSLICLAEQLKANSHGIVYGIDPWSDAACVEGFPSGLMDGWAAREGLAERHNETMWHLTNRALWPFVRIITGRSGDVAHLFGPRSIDVLHIDGNHSDDVATKDVQEYVGRCLKPGGYVWMDDIGHATDYVAMRLVHALCEHVADADRYRLFQKRT
jgi:predicted O-methyltransferase YrrM